MPIDPRRFRDTLGRFATGVTVVTTAHGDHEHGMTANAFVSVSLEPPLVAVSVAKRARMHSLVQGSGRFGVSVLAEDQEAVARHFAGSPDAAIDVPLRRHGNLPLVGGGVAWLTAAVTAAHDAGDHTLFVGEVDWLDDARGTPLLFYEGRLFGLEATPLPGRGLAFPLEITSAPEIQRHGHTLVADWP